MNFTVIANCQSGPMANIISTLAPSANHIRVKPIHTLIESDLPSFDESIKNSDLIIHQPIGESFKSYSINEIKNRFPNKQFISFPSLFFTGYWPWMMYLRMPTGGTLKGLTGDYHDQRIVESFINGKSVPETILTLENTPLGKDFISEELNKLQIRERNLDAKSSEFIAENYQNEMLFYVMNHPSNSLIIHCAIQLLEKIDIKITNSDLSKAKLLPDYLSNIFTPVDSVARKTFDIITNKSDLYTLKEVNSLNQWTMSEYISNSFEIYKNTSDIEKILEYAINLKIKIGY